jgi:hypothetical protein
MADFKRKPMPDELDILNRPLCTRWNPKNLAERATIEDIEGSHAPRSKQHLADLSAFRKLTFSGVVPKPGFIGKQVDRISSELQGIDALAAKPGKTEETA